MALEIMITVGGSDYYLSDEGHSGASFGATAGSQYYYPFVAVPPRLTWGPTGGGYISVQAGSLSLVNKPYDSNHPFSGTNYRNLLSDAGTTTNLPTIAIKDSTKYSIFDGTLVFRNLTPENLTFSLESRSFNKYLGEDTATDDNGDTVYIPWPFGEVAFVQPAIYKGSQTWANGSTAHPGFNGHVDYHWSLYEDGTKLYVTGGNNTTSATEMDGSTDTPQYGGSQRLIWGYGTSHGGDVTSSADATEHMSDLAVYIAKDIGYTPTASRVKTDKAPSSTSMDIGFYLTEPIQDLELLSKVCVSTNHQFYITRNPDSGAGAFYGSPTLYLVDRANNPTATALTNSDIISSSYRISDPLQTVKTAFDNYSWRGSQLEKVSIEYASHNLHYGRILTLPCYTTTNQGVTYLNNLQGVLDAIRDIEKKPIASVVLSGIRDTYTPGDRFTFNREQDQVKVDMLARSISWDWASRQTTLSGDATLSIYEAS